MSTGFINRVFVKVSEPRVIKPGTGARPDEPETRVSGIPEYTSLSMVAKVLKEATGRLQMLQD